MSEVPLYRGTSLIPYVPRKFDRQGIAGQKLPVAWAHRDVGNRFCEEPKIPPSVKTTRSVSSRWAMSAQPGLANFGRFLPAAAHESCCSCSCELRG